MTIDEERRKEVELLDAIVALDEDAVKKYVASGTDVNAQHSYPSHGLPLATAINRARHPDSQHVDTIANFLIESGARAALGDNSLPDLATKALRTESLPQTALSLLSLTIEVIDKNKALVAAVESNHVRAMRVLINAGADINFHAPRGNSPLLIAAEKGNIETVEMILDSGAIIQKGDLEGVTAMHLAASRGHIKIIQALLELGVDINARAAHGTIPLHAATHSRQIQAAKFLLDRGADINSQDRAGMTPILIAASNGCHEVATILLELSPNLTLTGRDGLTSLGVAVNGNDEEMAYLLLNHLSPRKKANNVGALSLDRAISSRDYRNVPSLLKKGAQVALRGIKTSELMNSGERHPIVGPGNLYLEALCSIAGGLEAASLGESCTDENTSSVKSFLFASESLLHCLTRHANCIDAEGSLPTLPSRVIDIDPPDKPQDVVILRPGLDVQARYIALSHRWGPSVTVKTTKSNLAAHLKGIKVGNLTKVMQDAVTVARGLGIRYLWIDALCIIQDSHSDWSTEACDMANIYRNSFVTIAAAASASHSDGLFTKRRGDRTLPDPSSDTLDSRGWILQEQLLSPRILKYSDGQLSWECLSLTTFDRRPDDVPVSATPSTEILRFKRALGGFRSTSMALQAQAYGSWRHIVQLYSHRVLTNEADKLMAVMGIARFTSEITGDRFLAGLWKNQLYRDLLWRSDISFSEGALPSRIHSIKLPSWSWASVSGPVAYAWPAGSSPGSVVDDLTLVSDDVSSEISNGDVQGRLVVRARLRKVFFSGKDHDDAYRLFHKSEPTQQAVENMEAKSEREPNTDFYEEKRQAELDEVKTAKSTMSNLHEPFWPDIRGESFTEAWLFPVASEYYWYHCLVVVKVGQGNVFRRIGLCHVDKTRSPSFFNWQAEDIITLI